MPALNRATRGTSKAGAILTALILVAMLLPGAVLAAPGPTVLSISRVSSTPTSAAALSWTVTFSEAVTGVDVADFVTVPGGTLGGIPAVTGVTGTGANYTVTASTGSGSGTLGLNLVDDDSIINNATPTPVPLGGAGAANGNFTGEFLHDRPDRADGHERDLGKGERHLRGRRDHPDHSHVQQVGRRHRHPETDPRDGRVRCHRGLQQRLWHGQPYLHVHGRGRPNLN